MEKNFNKLPSFRGNSYLIRFHARLQRFSVCTARRAAEITRRIWDDEDSGRGIFIRRHSPNNFICLFASLPAVSSDTI